MTIDALVIDSNAVETLSQAGVRDEWFNDFSIPPNREDLRRSTIGQIVYILSRNASEDSELFICNMRFEGGIGSAPNIEKVFNSAIRMALARFGKSVGIPSRYKPYRRGPLSSIQAYRHHMNNNSRLYFRYDKHLYLYAMSNKTVDIDEIYCPLDLYNEVINSFEDALLSILEDKVVPDNVGNYSIIFDDYIGKTYSRSGTTIDEWYNRVLTDQQRKFVDAPMNNPIRLRGSAGTGKTQCMTIKCLKELFEAEENEKELRIGFLTHSSGVAHEVVEGMMWALDAENRRCQLQHTHLWLGSLYELAKEMLGYDSKQITPLSLDGADGRKVQRELVQICVDECRKSMDFSNCSDYIRKGLISSSMDDGFLRELSNEIACSLDSEGVRKSDADKVAEYLNGKRHPWQMELEYREDRQVILDIHAEYIKLLADTDTINLDQMIADFLGYLNSNEWSIYRKNSDGFDVIFIDELHYFNRYERMIFHSLIRETAIQEGRLPLFMAYDMKQSTDDRALTSAGATGRFFRDLRAGSSELVELTKVFRSTPQIASLLEYIDGAFPALDLEGEWQTYTGKSEQDDGDVPVLRLYDTTTLMLDKIVEDAYRFALRKGGKNVAVLCMSDSRFMMFANAGRIRNKISVVESNTDLAEIKYAKQRCVFSMPENVAGLQFERVYVIDVDSQEMADDGASLGNRRQMLSRLYLAASRASRHLILAASREGGGYSDVLEIPLHNGTLIRKN